LRWRRVRHGRKYELKEGVVVAVCPDATVQKLQALADVLSRFKDVLERLLRPSRD
jgi:hypothetical protein